MVEAEECYRLACRHAVLDLINCRRNILLVDTLHLEFGVFCCKNG